MKGLVPMTKTIILKLYYRDRCILVPTLLSWNDSGISLENFQMALSPVQCMGTIISGASSFIAATVGSMEGSMAGPVR